jgi:Cu+-exporting ATPase
VLFESAEAIEKAAKLTAIVFDKTGTLTRGQPSVTDVVLGRPELVLSGVEPQLLSLTPKDILQWAAGTEANSEHPLGEAIILAARERGLQVPAADSFNSLPGRGVEARIAGRTVFLGNRKLMAEQGVDLGDLASRAETLEQNGKTVMFLALASAERRPVVAGLIGVADTLKEHSAEAVRRLQQLGIEVAMLTGDNRRTAEAIAAQVGIDRVLAEVLPQDKAEQVRSLQAQGRKVAIVGDGVNGAPALAQANVGIAIGSGTDVAKKTGEVILVKEDLRDVVVAIEIAKATIRKVKENLFWAFVYNAISIPLGAGILYPLLRVVVSPEWAAFLMAISSLTVTLNTLRMRGYVPSLKRQERHSDQGSGLRQLAETPVATR